MELEKIKKIVFEEKHVFAGIYEKYKDKSWLEYLKENRVGKSQGTKENLEILNKFEEILSPLLGDEKALNARETLENNFFASTADHHGILCHPFFLNSALARSQKEILDSKKNIIVLSCGGVSLSNSSYPRGIFFHNQNLEEIRIPFVSLKYRTRSVYGMKALSKEDIQKSFNKVISKSDGIVEDKLENLKEKILRREEIFKAETLSEQYTILNDLLWKETFAGARGNLVYLEMESLVRKLLLDIHLKEPSVIHKIILDEKWRKDFLNNFEGIQGAHNTKEKKGSHLFWYIDEKSEKRFQLFVKENNLETLDGKISIPLAKEALKKNLLEYRLLPTMALSFSIISFWHGITCGGGFSQVEYLGEMKRAFEKTLRQNNFKREILERTNIFTGEFILATISGRKNKSAGTSLPDFYIYGNNKISDMIDEKIAKEKIGKTIDAEIPEYYKIITGKTAEIKNPAKILPIITSKKIKPKCVYCGNNPTNHFFSYLMQTATVPFTPLVRTISIFADTKPIRILAKGIMTPYMWIFRAMGMLSMNKDKNKAFTKRSEVIWEEAEKRGIRIEQFVIWGKPIEQYRAKIDGWWKYFESLPIPGELPSHSYTWMDDKALLKKKFIKEKLPVAYGGSATTWKEAKNIFEKAKKPVIVKPQLGSRGRHTTTHIYTLSELRKAYDVAKQMCHFALIEEHLFGSVYRGTYVGGKIVGILRGDPPRIIGDGKNNISQLIDLKNQKKHEGVKDVIITNQLEEFLSRQNLTLETILPKEKIIDLSEKIGISYGGFSVEEFPTTHPKIISELKRAGDFLNAPVIGFDFIIEDATKDPDAQKWGIIEANSLPFINLHHFPLEGKPINVAGKVWDLWVKKKVEGGK